MKTYITILRQTPRRLVTIIGVYSFKVSSGIDVFLNLYIKFLSRQGKDIDLLF